MNATTQTLPPLANLSQTGAICAKECSLDSARAPFGRPDAVSNEGSVYVAVACDATGTPFFKVGFSTSPEKRVASLRGNASPYGPATLIAYTKARLVDESALHLFLANYRETGEWYRPCRRIERLLFHIGKHGSLPQEVLSMADSLSVLWAAKRECTVKMNELSRFFAGRFGSGTDWPRLAYGPNSGPDRMDTAWAFDAYLAGLRAIEAMLADRKRMERDNG